MSVMQLKMPAVTSKSRTEGRNGRVNSFRPEP